MKLPAALLALMAPVAANAGRPPCVSSSALVTPAMFARYPAPVTRGPSRAPDVSRGEARRYRTVLRGEGRSAPDFAGHYQIVRIGCGAGSFCVAFADRLTGHVSFVDVLRVVSWLTSSPSGIDERLTYRKDSRLLVVIGERNEDTNTAGASLYTWRDGQLRLLRFVPSQQLCGIGDVR